MSADGMPVVQVIRQLDPNLCSVTVDNVSVGYQAVQHLISKGCRNIGLINGSMQISPYAERYEGYSKAIRENKLKEITMEIPSKNRGVVYGHDSTERLLDENAKLDAILAATDAQGMGVLRALKENGLRVPQDIRVVSMTGYRLGEMLETTLTSMELPEFEIGVSAANMAIAAIEADKSQPISVRHVSFSAVLTPRESTM
jgi:LacI family transcriptional regulator